MVFDEPLTHKCNVCGNSRPESHIGVNSKPGFDYVVVYCIDKEYCIEESGEMLKRLIQGTGKKEGAAQ